MSVIKAILFYSKYDQKSLRMKTVIDNLGADIETVSVDSLKVRERLQEDEKYGIDKVPAVLLLYSSGQHKTYTNRGLDEWFDQLIQNIQEYHQQQQAMMQPSETAIDDDEQMYTQLDDGVPKALRRSPTDMSGIPTSLPSPGRPSRSNDNNVTSLMSEGTGGIGGSGSGMSDTPSGFGGINSAQAAMISEHIKDAEPTVAITSDPHIQSGRKEVKKDGLSAAEIAKQMAEQREVYEDQLEENRPFM